MQVIRSMNEKSWNWYGNFSRCVKDGSIETDLIKVVSNLNPNIIILFPRSDGFVKSNEIGCESTVDETKLNEIKSKIPKVAIVCLISSLLYLANAYKHLICTLDKYIADFRF